ncbi:MAG: 6-bladed beta-propeller [Bacteroidaceae bacterium]|nr:6-bladed beta-propeller [Bacteroidaceae bacterium]
MQKITIAFALTVGSLFCGCSQNQKYNTTDGFITCDVGRVKELRTVNLSEWVEDLRIVQFENSEAALFQYGWQVIAGNYIGIRQGGNGVFKLFDRNGKFLCNVGALGAGHGEYSNRINSAVIDEDREQIYLTESPCAHSNIHVYGMDGKFRYDIPLDEELYSPKMTLNGDGTISLVQLCLNKCANPTLITHIKNGEVIAKTKPHPSMITDSPADKDLFHDVMCYSCMGNMYVWQTSNDTLYRYDTKTQSIKPAFTLAWQDRTEDTYYQYNVIPGKYIADVITDVRKYTKKGTIVYDQESQEAYYIKLKNDSAGGIEAPTTFANGYFYDMYHPMQLREVIEKRLYESDCTEEDKSSLRKLYDSLDEDGNYIMFVGKLKERI